MLFCSGVPNSIARCLSHVYMLIVATALMYKSILAAASANPPLAQIPKTPISSGLTKNLVCK
ncbi:hypothetical protein SNTW_04720 [Helicobacter suis]|uniref:Uncharacterized protein n=1 Tax=Helicobacter suis TaxID=104628 RepID=A0A6J4CWG5_9HELI|nr:hypothetical protein SNTW_04720 [Helicobacter suis]